MDRGLASLLWAVIAALAPRIEDPWVEAWKKLQRLEGMPSSSPEARQISSELSELAQHDGPRATVLSAHLDRLHGRRAMDEWIDEFEPGEPWPFDEEGSWCAAEVLPPGKLRNQALAEAMALHTEPLDAAQVRLVFDGWIEAAQDLRFDEALALGVSLHEEVKADWSAFSLSLTFNRAGKWPEADRVLEEAIELGIDPVSMWAQRGIYALGAGREDLGRSFLSRAIESGSMDALAVLARLELSHGRYAAARKGFKEVLLREPDYPWAGYGFGLSLVLDRPWTRPASKAKLSGPDPRQAAQPAPSTALRKP